MDEVEKRDYEAEEQDEMFISIEITKYSNLKNIIQLFLKHLVAHQTFLHSNYCLFKGL